MMNRSKSMHIRISQGNKSKRSKLPIIDSVSFLLGNRSNPRKIEESLSSSSSSLNRLECFLYNAPPSFLSFIRFRLCFLVRIFRFGSKPERKKNCNVNSFTVFEFKISRELILSVRFASVSTASDFSMMVKQSSFNTFFNYIGFKFVSSPNFGK